MSTDAPLRRSGPIKANPSRRELLNLAASAIGGPADTDDAHEVLSLALERLRKKAWLIIQAAEHNSVTEIQGCLITLEAEIKALETLVDDYLEVEFVTFDDEQETAVPS